MGPQYMNLILIAILCLLTTLTTWYLSHFLISNDPPRHPQTFGACILGWGSGRNHQCP
jgi:hypothetical protein